MAWDFRLGMKVVRIADSFCSERVAPLKPNLPVVGGVYTIESVGLFIDVQIIRLVELPNKHWTFGDGSEPGFYAANFRPVRETSIDCLRVHLAPKNLRDCVES